MKTACYAFTRKYWTLHEAHKLRDGEGFFESVELLLCDPPCNFHRQHDLQNSYYEVFKAESIEDFCDFSEYIPNCGAHRLIFSYDVQFAFLWRRFQALPQMVENDFWETNVFVMRWRRCLSVMRTLNISKTHALSACDTHTWCNKQVASVANICRSILRLHSCATLHPMAKNLYFLERRIKCPTSHVFRKMNQFSEPVWVNPVLRLCFASNRSPRCGWGTSFASSSSPAGYLWTALSVMSSMANVCTLQAQHRWSVGRDLDAKCAASSSHNWLSNSLVKYWKSSRTLQRTKTSSKLHWRVLKNGGSGPKMLLQFMLDACWISHCAYISLPYSLLFMNRSYGVFSLWSGEKQTYEFLDTS